MPARGGALKVLQVIPSIAAVHGGPSLAIRSIEKALSARGCAVTTVTTDDAGPGTRALGGAAMPVTPGVERIQFPKRTEFYKVSPEMGAWLWRNVGRFDVVHVHALFSFSSTAATLAARRSRVPYILRPLGSLSRYGVSRRRPWLKRVSIASLEGPALRHAAAVHFTSSAEEEEAGDLGVPMNGVVLPLGIEAVPMVNRERSRSTLGLERGDLTILALSRVDPKKNFEGLLRALAILDREDLRPALLVAGTGEASYVRSLRDLAHREGVAARIHWLGHVSGDAKADLLAAADVFVLPSLSENFGLAAVEAMSAALPCVLGQGVALSAEVSQGGAGVVVEPDPESIASGLRYLLRDAEARRAAGVAAHALFHREYSLSRMGERLTSLYASVRRGTDGGVR